jgi:hypothetical protein
MGYLCEFWGGGRRMPAGGNGASVVRGIDKHNYDDLEGGGKNVYRASAQKATREWGAKAATTTPEDGRDSRHP